MRWRSLFFIFFGLISGLGVSEGADDLARLLEESRHQNLQADRMWRALLHYHSNLWGKDKSDIDGPDFFLSKFGRTEPQAELEATLTAFFEQAPLDPEKQHPRCQYPARYAWLNEKLNLDQILPEMSCGRYESWLEKLDPGSVAIVFSGYYLNNPASMYGHTFLRVGRRPGQGSEKPLLDYTVNFAAKTTTRSGLAFAVLGLAGGYPGSFTSIPYYMKVQQYNNLESRDLWEYKLNFPQGAIDRLMAHLWEMGPTTISYYFLNKNCSYQLLPMLEVADPTLNLSSSFRFRAIPVDTLKKVLGQKGLVSGSVFRPSALRKMVSARDQLNSQEQNLAQAFAMFQHVGTEEELKLLPLDRQKKVLEAAYEGLRYRSGFYRNQPVDVQERERRILLLLNGLPGKSADETLGIPEPPAPHLAQKTGRMGLSFGADRANSFEEFSARGALHDLESDPAGFVSGSQLEMMVLRVRYENKRSRLYVEEATGIQVKSLAPWEPWIHKPSWQLKIHFNRARDLNQAAEGSGQAGVVGGSGISVRVPYLKEGLFYSMLEMDGGVGGVYRDHYRLGVGPTVGVVGAVTSRWRIHFNAAYIRYGAGNISSANRLRLVQSLQLPHDYELRGTLERHNHHQEGMISLNRYF